MNLANRVLKRLTVKNILSGLGIIGFCYTVFSFGIFAVGGIFVTNLLEDYNSGNYTKVKQDLTITNYPPPKEQTEIMIHYALPIMHIAPYVIMTALIVMYFYIILFSRFEKPKLNNPFKKSSWTQSQDGKLEDKP